MPTIPINCDYFPFFFSHLVEFQKLSILGHTMEEPYCFLNPNAETGCSQAFIERATCLMSTIPIKDDSFPVFSHLMEFQILSFLGHTIQEPHCFLDPNAEIDVLKHLEGICFIILENI